MGVRRSLLARVARLEAKRAPAQPEPVRRIHVVEYATEADREAQIAALLACRKASAHDIVFCVNMA